MAHIYIFSPSSAVRDKAAFRRGVKRLQAQGHQVELDEAALASHMRFAGDDATRITAITRAAASGADVALISRGGYGLTRLLPRLPFAELQQAIDRSGAPTTVETFGRHDPCVGIRATPIAEAMLALVVMEHVLQQRAQCADVRVSTPRIPGSV